MKFLSPWLISFVLFCIPCTLHSQIFDWAQSAGGNDWDEGTAITVDDAGNVYTTGHFRGTVDFDAGPGIFNMTSIGDRDIFISKTDPTGSLIWAKQFGGTSHEESNAIVLDQNANIYITGSFTGQVDFNPGTGIFNLSSTYMDRDIFIQKLDSSGQFVWAKQISGYSPTLTSIPSPVNAYAMAIDNADNLYITGYFDGTVDFDPNPNDTHYLNIVAYSDIFVGKYDSMGNFIWVRQFGGTEGGVGYAITTDHIGNVYSTGTIGGSAVVDFDPGPGIFNLTGSDPFQTEIYVSMLDSSGNFGWATTLGQGQGAAIAVNQNGEVYTGGWYPSGITPVLNMLNTSGGLIWSKSIGGINIESIAIDNSDNIYTTGGCFSGTHDFDPGPGIFNITCGSSDAFISKWDASGNFSWATQFTASNQVFTEDITVDNNYNIYTTGFYDATTDFDPSAAISNLNAIGSYDIFIQKMSVHSLELTENNFTDDFQIFPNPTTDKLTVKTNLNPENLKFTFRNMAGQIIDIQPVTIGNNIEFLINAPAGVYLLEVTDGNYHHTVTRIIKQ